MSFLWDLTTAFFPQVGFLLSQQSMTTSPASSAKAKLRWYQFSLRSLLIYVTLFAVACSWFTVKMQQARKQRKEVEEMTRLGANVYYSYQCDENSEPIESCVFMKPDGTWQTVNTPEPSVPQWLLSILSDDFFYRATAIELFNLENVDALKEIETCRRAKLVHFRAWISESLGDEEIRERLQKSFPRCKIVTTRVTHVSWLAH
jgi:hypothetical protein